MPGRTFTTLLDRAQHQYGFLTPDDARELDIDPTQLRLMASRDTLEHLGHGLYRMPAVQPNELDAYMEAVLRTGRRGVISHETALDLYELCDVNPASIHLTVPKGFRTRKQLPTAYQLHQADLSPDEVSSHEGIPIVTAERAIRGGVERALGWHLIDQAIRNARGRGLIDQATAKRLRALRGAPGSPAEKPATVGSAGSRRA